ncbi:glycosyl hydrolase family 18 protein [Chitinophaga sp. sic0106]|uniref:EndoS/ChiA family endoglycosidase n=1 Tax=Chitinophaga sp. sic0106 TaxID=2854785 RepID=UPI001C4425FC|nr:glycosyl hydrolase family 18 protein [Chitinophaga sp. sic0106]MBV7533733.1 hypothetical protein [Chitinophaga sp. sic0106]
MRKQHLVAVVPMLLLVLLTSCTKKEVAPLAEPNGPAVRTELVTLPAAGQNKVAYYAFDATPQGQGYMSLTNFTDKANIIVVFEGTLWELADTVNYNSGWMINSIYKNKKKVLEDIQTLRSQGKIVLMNVDDAASWSTATPFTTYNGTGYNYTQFASFINTCVNTVGLDGISLDVEHGATDNTNYRNLIKELGKYFGPLSSSPTTKIYTGAFYSGGAPGPSFRDTALAKYLNFVMDMGYFNDNTSRFNYWAATLGNAKVMDGMSYDYNSQSSAVSHAQWHPSPDKAGVMVFAGNVNKAYTDAVLDAVTTTTTPGNPNDVTDLGGTTTAQYNNSPSGEEIGKLTDNSTSTKYLTTNGSGWVQFHATTAAVVKSYTITSANDVPNRDPKNWTLQGSNNGTSWTTLDTQTNQTFATRFLKKTYTITNTTSYAYYRLNVSAVVSGTIMQMSEWELLKI